MRNPTALALVAALFGCAPAAPAGDDARVATDAATDAVAVDAAPFAPAPHDPLIVIPDVGGPVLADVHLVTITYANDAATPVLQALGDWFFDSGYVVKVGFEYGVKSGRQVARVQLAENAPDVLTDGDIQSLIARHIADGVLPAPDAGTLYMLYVLDTTRVETSFGGGCSTFDGYHSQGRLADGARYAYALVVPCAAFRHDTTSQEQLEIAASHELMEAATDPLPGTRPGYRLDNDPFATISYGGEVGDLCEQHPWRQDGFAVQRIWSNAAALAAVASPCVPVPLGELFLGITVDTPDDATVAPGGTLAFTIHTWSNLPSPPWGISVGTHVDGYTDITNPVPPLAVTNGTTSTVTVGVGPDAVSGSTAVGYLEVVGPRGVAFDSVRVPIQMQVQ